MLMLNSKFNRSYDVLLPSSLLLVLIVEIFVKDYPSLWFFIIIVDLFQLQPFVEIYFQDPGIQHKLVTKMIFTFLSKPVAVKFIICS